MTVVAGLLSSHEIEAYDRFVKNCSNSLIYHTSIYCDFLKVVLVDAEFLLFVAKRDGSIVGSLACFLKESELGKVINSLPYFGSHGDILVSDAELEKAEVVTRLSAALVEFCRERGVGAINIVSNLAQPQFSAVAASYGLSNWSMRIGQISMLPQVKSHEDAVSSILQACTQKTRNLVRKGIRNNFNISHSAGDEEWGLLAKHHAFGMQRIGGSTKSVREFWAVREHFQPLDMSRLYTAYRGNEFAGSLLVLRYGKSVEYFTPVSTEKYRSEQVLSALIVRAMSDAALDGARVWNWGGTWPNQLGVYHFKKGWGADDCPYDYIGAILDRRFSEIEPSIINENFPFFFVRPFNFPATVQV